MPRLRQATAGRSSPILALLIAATSVQGGAALAKSLFPALGPISTSGVRLVFAAALLLLVFRPPLHRLRRTDWRLVVPYGLSLGAMNLTFYGALERIPLGLAVTLEFAGPLGVALFASRRRLDFAWVLLAALGILLIAPWDAEGAGVDPLGAALALIAGGFWAAYIVTGGRLSRRLDQGTSVTSGMLVAAALGIPFALADGVLGKMTPALLGLGLLMAALASAIPYALEMVALRTLPGRIFGVLMSLEPVVATFAGWLFLGEQLTPLQWLAVFCVCSASAGATYASRAARTKETPAPLP